MILHELAEVLEAHVTTEVFIHDMVLCQTVVLTVSARYADALEGSLYLVTLDVRLFCLLTILNSPDFHKGGILGIVHVLLRPFLRLLHRFVFLRLVRLVFLRLICLADTISRLCLLRGTATHFL